MWSELLFHDLSIKATTMVNPPIFFLCISWTPEKNNGILFKKKKDILKNKINCLLLFVIFLYVLNIKPIVINCMASFYQ